MGMVIPAIKIRVSPWISLVPVSKRRPMLVPRPVRNSQKVRRSLSREFITLTMHHRSDRRLVRTTKVIL